jgi:prolyl oligopeptidase
MDAITNTIIEDTIVDVKFSGVSWRMKGFYYPVTTNQRKRIIGKTDSINCISINGNGTKDDKVILVPTKNIVM